MGVALTYNVYDGDTLILENVRRTDIADYLGVKLPNITSYIRTGDRVLRRYTITYADEDKIPMSYEESVAQRWAEAVRPFKNVIWVEKGGRKLRVGGKT